MAAQRIPPHSLEAEESVLGSILIDPEAIIKVAELLSPPAFYESKHQAIYAGMAGLYEKRRPIDVV
ncbi:MAG TPA: DnaB-like helicase N-terminal domain-containing protein, partial [Candidatus Woesebacteria bacterium]|nr:DnaB-like helicase N-terminal domain-containing protein [Candidatus Woesebacteria bacterium]